MIEQGDDDAGDVVAPDALPPRTAARTALPPRIAAADDPAVQIRDLVHLVEELTARVKILEGQARHQQTSWAQRVFLIQPDGGGTLYSESSLSYSGTNPTTVPLSDQTGTIARSFLQGDLIIPPADAATVMAFHDGTQTAYVKLPGGDARYVRLESAGAPGTFTGKQMTANGSGTLTATTNTATVYELGKTAVGYNLGTGSNATVVSIDGKNEFRSSILTYNGGTLIASVGGINMGTGLASVMKFAANGMDLVLLPGSQYEVVQMDSTASKLVILPVRAIP